jgi:hypothetical protein
MAASQRLGVSVSLIFRLEESSIAIRNPTAPVTSLINHEDSHPLWSFAAGRRSQLQRGDSRQQQEKQQ